MHHWHPKPSLARKGHYDITKSEISMGFYHMEGTVKPAPHFEVTEDCRKLRKAMVGLGSDEQAIIDVLGHRSRIQRLEIAENYKILYDKDLRDELKNELSGHFKSTCIGLVLPLDIYLATRLRKALKGAGTDEAVLIEVLCTRPDDEILALKKAYSQKYDRDLEKDVESDTSGKFRDLLITLLGTNRDNNCHLDLEEVEKAAKSLTEYENKKISTEDESKLIDMLTSRSHSHLRAVFIEYGNITGKYVDHVIRSVVSGDIKPALLAIVGCVKYPPAYYADQMKKSMKGAGTKDATLVRLVVSRCEIDMVQIKDEFTSGNKLKHTSLAQMIRDDISGDYKKLILALIDEPEKKMKKITNEEKTTHL